MSWIIDKDREKFHLTTTVTEKGPLKKEQTHRGVDPFKYFKGLFK